MVATPKIKLGNGSDVYHATLEDLSKLIVDGGGGYDIFTLDATPTPIMRSVPIFTESPTDDPNFVPQPTGERTVNSTGILNEHLKHFEEIDFSATTPIPADGTGDGTGFYKGLDLEREFAVDASTLDIHRLGVLASGDDATFANLSEKDQVIAKVGVSNFVALNLDAEREHKLNLDPFNGSNSSGRFEGDGVVKLQVNAGVDAIVTENLKFEQDSDYHKLILTGDASASVRITNYAADTYHEALNDDSIIDASDYKGTLYVGNAASVSETMIFGKGTDHTNLAGSTYAEMDFVKKIGNGDFVDLSGNTNYTPGELDGNAPPPPPTVFAYPYDYAAIDPLSEQGTFHFSSVKKQLNAAADLSETDHKTVWFKGADGNTYIVDHFHGADTTLPGPTITLSVATTDGIEANDFALKLQGLHTLVADGQSHLVVADGPHQWDLLA